MSEPNGVWECTVPSPGCDCSRFNERHCDTDTRHRFPNAVPERFDAIIILPAESCLQGFPAQSRVFSCPTPLPANGVPGTAPSSRLPCCARGPASTTTHDPRTTSHTRPVRLAGRLPGACFFVFILLPGKQPLPPSHPSCSRIAANPPPRSEHSTNSARRARNPENA